MKNFLALVGSSVAALGISLMSVSCGDKNDKESIEESKDADLESQMVGYWAPNVEAMEKEMLKEIGDNPNAAALAPMMTAMLAGMSVEIKKGEVTVHVMGQASTVTYKITKTDADTKTLTMSVEEDGDTEEGTAMIDGDQLVLTMADGKKLDLHRIDEAAFKKRQESALTPPAGLPGIPGGKSPLPPVE